MERFNCHVIGKKICTYPVDESVLVAEYCPRCTIPDVYRGIRPKVPESHCEAGKVTGYEMPPEGKETDIDRLYYYLHNHTNVFKGMALDEQGKLMMELEKILDKYDRFK